MAKKSGTTAVGARRSSIADKHATSGGRNAGLAILGAIVSGANSVGTNAITLPGQAKSKIGGSMAKSRAEMADQNFAEARGNAAKGTGLEAAVKGQTKFGAMYGRAPTSLAGSTGGERTKSYTTKDGRDYKNGRAINKK